MAVVRDVRYPDLAELLNSFRLVLGFTESELHHRSVRNGRGIVTQSNISRIEHRQRLQPENATLRRLAAALFYDREDADQAIRSAYRLFCRACGREPWDEITPEEIDLLREHGLEELLPSFSRANDLCA